MNSDPECPPKVAFSTSRFASMVPLALAGCPRSAKVGVALRWEMLLRHSGASPLIANYHYRQERIVLLDLCMASLLKDTIENAGNAGCHAASDHPAKHGPQTELSQIASALRCESPDATQLDPDGCEV